MFTKYNTFVLALLSGSATAKLLADFVPQFSTFEERSARTAGGFSLVTSTTTCPPATQNCGDSWCCPIGLTCTGRGDDTGNVVEPCCPAGMNCLAGLQEVPLCADSTWTLWNATLESGFATGYFCCSAGLIGLQSQTCVEANTISESTGLAVEVTVSTSAVIPISVATETVGASSSAAASSSALSFGNSTMTSGTTITSTSPSTTNTATSTATVASTTATSSVEANPTASTAAASSASASASAKSEGTNFRIMESALLLPVVAALAFMGL